ncbi:hypothetical protein K7432_004821 [Basidiobolus ranarum]|uniref:Cytidyltransferase-like domain-containing protein n=1 Tax=Basidiobolus ranarum TaxID=34480 RepID=A0ABR2W418_9FUNG
MSLTTSRNRLTELLKSLAKESSSCLKLTYKTSENWLPARNARIVVLDSSFNPPTRAHLQLIYESLKLKPSFDACLLLIATNNADKTLSGASLEQRLEMMQILATHLQEHSSNPGASNVAVGVVNKGIFSEKVAALKATFASNDSRFYFVTGFDTVIRIFDSKYYKTPVVEALSPIFDTGGIVCANRTGFDPELVKEFYESEAVRHFSEHTHQIELNEEIAGLSSTKARNVIETKASRTELEKIVIPEIAEYLIQEQLYIK